MARGTPDQDLKLTPAERAVLEHHFGKALSDDLSIHRSAEFPEVLRISGLTHNSDSAQWAGLAMIVGGVWIDGGGSGAFMLSQTFWLSDQATRQILQTRGWSTLDESQRKMLVLRWIIDSRPLDSNIQTGANGGHAAEVDVEGRDIVVRVWLIEYLTNIAGRHAIQQQEPRIFRFKPDGSMTEQKEAGVD